MIKRSGGVQALAVLAALGMLLAGCSGDDPDENLTWPGPDGAGAAGLAERLAELPGVVAGDGDQLVQVAIADLDRAAELAGVTRPAGSTDSDQVREYVNALTGQFADGPPVSALFPEAANLERLAQVEEFATEVGWSVADVSWFAEYQVPPDTVTVVGGDLDESRLTGALGERPDDRIWRLGGEDYEVSLEEVSAARPLGQALRLALVDDRLAIARSTPPVEAVLTGGTTLAEDPTLSALAAAMDDENAYSTLLLAGAPGTFQAQLPTPQAQAEGADGLPQPFIGIAAGSAQVDGAPYAIFAYVHATEADAAANAEGLRALLEQGASVANRAPWSDQFGVDDIRVDGTTVLARLTIADGVPAIIPYNLLLRQDNLATHQ